MRSADGANATHTLTSTETLEPITITVTLVEANRNSSMGLSSPLLNGTSTAVSVATHASEGTLASASSLATTGSATIDGGSKCSGDAGCVGGGKKEAKALVDSAGGRKLGVQWALILLGLLACLWLWV